MSEKPKRPDPFDFLPSITNESSEMQFLMVGDFQQLPEGQAHWPKTETSVTLLIGRLLKL